MRWIKDKKAYILAFIIPVILYCIILAVRGIYPFGSLANIAADENLQYEQFFTYYFNVLHGTAEVGYSLSKSIGGSLVGLWGYYLASPINLVLFFFKEMNVLLFVFLVTGIKIGLCGLTFAIFIKNLFRNLKSQSVVILSVAYAFTQYVVGQMSNVMWLDGVYLLPLILYFIDKFLEKGSKIGLFITFICTIIFNWYTGYMNCLFAVLYFVYRLICLEHKKENKSRIKSIVKKTFSFLCIEALSVAASAVVFIPIVLAQLGSRTGNSVGIFNFETNGSFLGMLRGFMIGSDFPSPTITMFCSILMLILIVYYFADRKIESFEKRATIGLVCIMVASLFFCPLEHIWVGFSFETSFQIRFLYVVILTILLLAARVLSEPLDRKLLTKVIIGIIGVFLILDLFQQFSPKRLWAQILILVIYLVIFTKCKNKKWGNRCLMSLFLVEILLNAYLVTADTYNVNKNYYEEYAANEKKMINQIRPRGNDFYRIETNIDRDVKRDSFISNESLSYSYGTIEQYTSSYDRLAGVFLGDLGYSRSEFPTFYHEPILPADSLLGVKYLLTDELYDGFTLKDEFKSYNGKNVYENEYVLPFVFNTSDEIKTVVNSGNPFEYLNDIYSGIAGHEVNLFKSYDMNVSEDGDNLIYSSSADENENVLYMRIDGENLDLSIKRDGGSEEQYLSDHLNHNVLVLGNTEEAHSLEIMNVSKDEINVQFYVLDLNEFKSVIHEIKSSSVDVQKVSDGEIQFMASGENVLISIPYDNDWEITVNGKEVKPVMGASALMVIPLDGDNSEVVMTYHVKGARIGIVFTIISIGIFSMWIILDKRAKK